MNTPPDPKPEAGTIINLGDIADRYLEVYQRLFDVAGFLWTAGDTLTDAHFSRFREAFPIMPTSGRPRNLQEAKEVSSQWLTRCILSEALSTVVPLLEDSRTVLALCDYKAAGKSDPLRVQQITGRDRQEFMAMDVAQKLDHLKAKYQIHSDLSGHLLSLLAIAKDLVMNEGRASQNQHLKIRSITLAEAAPPQPDGGQPAPGSPRRIADSERAVPRDQTIALTKAELIGSLITIAGFLASLLEGVQRYAQIVGAAEDGPRG